MPARNLLHKNDVPTFLAWLDLKGIAHRPGRGDWQICQIQRNDGWFPLFSRANMPEHVTVPDRLNQLVRVYLSQKGKHRALPQISSETPTDPASASQAGCPSPVRPCGPSAEGTREGSPPWEVSQP